MAHSGKSLTLRPLVPDDVVPAAEVVSASGLSTTHDELRRQSALPGATLVGAWLEGRLAGVAGAISYGVNGVIGPMSVPPDMQGGGIGTALLRYILDWLHRAGTEVMTLDATPVGAPLYRRHGFIRDHWTLHMVRERHAPHEVTVKTGEHTSLRVVRPEDASAIVLFDAPFFGAPRHGPLLAYLAEYPGRAFLVLDSEQIKGFGIAQARRIGPIVAVDPAVADLLLCATLSLPCQQGQVISLAESNAAGVALAAENGFVEARRLERMRLGGTAHPGLPNYHYAIMSYALG
jgi:GNAT superfamily N-acetyltransferase